jgi:hypothetical protein
MSSTLTLLSIQMPLLKWILQTPLPNNINLFGKFQSYLKKSHFDLTFSLWPPHLVIVGVILRCKRLCIVKKSCFGHLKLWISTLGQICLIMYELKSNFLKLSPFVLLWLKFLPNFLRLRSSHVRDYSITSPYPSGLVVKLLENSKKLTLIVLPLLYHPQVVNPIFPLDGLLMMKGNSPW